MAESATKKLQRRVEKAEGMALGMGFLLVKLNQQLGHHFGAGMAEQVEQAIEDFKRLNRAMRDRQAAGEKKEAGNG